MSLYAIIVAGGSGTRLWPLSRRATPKQILPVLGKQSLLASTWKRLRKELPASRILLVTNPAVAERARFELPELLAENLVVEPVRRETGPALGLGAAVVLSRDSKATVVNVNSDAHVKDAAGWWRAVHTAARVAERRHRITLVGVRPTYPETGYGYIEMGKPSGRGIFEVRGFREKPDRATAERYVGRWEFLWNPTLVVARASDLMVAYRKRLPRTWKALDAIRRAWRTGRRETELAKTFPKCDTISVDYGILEKEKDMLVVPADFGWSDVGHWRAVHDALAPKPSDDVTRGPHVGLDCSGNLFYSYSGKLIAAVGLKDMVVVETEDSILVVPKTRAQEVKKIVETLEARKMNDYL